MKTQGQRLKIIRATLGLHQKEIAEKLGIKQGTYSGYEGRDIPLSHRIRDRLIYELKVSPLFLDNGVGDPFLSDNGTVRDRIAALMTHLQMNIRVFCIALGFDEIETANFTLMLSGKGDPDRYINIISEKFSVNTQWLRNNVEPMFASQGRMDFSGTLPEQVNGVVRSLQDCQKENQHLKDQIELQRRLITLLEKGVKDEGGA